MRDGDSSGLSRRSLLTSGAAGFLATAGAACSQRDDEALERLERGKRDGGRRILIKGGVVLSLDPAVGDFEKADVLVEGRRIARVGPSIDAAAEVIDARGMIVLPGFIDTHHHQYQTLQRQILADGPRDGSWPERSYFSVVQDIWTMGRIPAVFDLGRSPYAPEDCYISELVASLSQIHAGITTGIDTSQSSHTPAHTDAMIDGLKDSGRRSVYAYWTGRADSAGFEYPGALGDAKRGLGRLRAQHFASDDALVTLALHADFDARHFALARSLGAPIVVHAPPIPPLLAALGDIRLLGPDIEYIHVNNLPETAWKLIADTGGKVSLAVPIEMAMGHGVPALQEALDAGLLPSLSTDVETNMSADPFTVMRAAYSLQRMLLFWRARAGETRLPPLLTCRQVLEMATIGGAKCAHLDQKIGTLTPGKEADIVLLSADAVNVFPMNNAPGAVVTMMDTSNVRHVIIAGQIRKWNGALVGVDVGKLGREITKSRDAVLGRIRSAYPAYRPDILSSCCIRDVYDVK